MYYHNQALCIRYPNNINFKLWRTVITHVSLVQKLLTSDDATKFKKLKTGTPHITSKFFQTKNAELFQKH